ncbi:MAG: hypothetical protein R2877_06405 [Bdellovibrionota bacterium]
MGKEHYPRPPMPLILGIGPAALFVPGGLEWFIYKWKSVFQDLGAALSRWVERFPVPDFSGIRHRIQLLVESAESVIAELKYRSNEARIATEGESTPPPSNEQPEEKKNTYEKTVRYRGQDWTLPEIKQAIRQWNAVPENEKITGIKSLDKLNNAAEIPHRHLVSSLLKAEGQTHQWLFGHVPDSYHLETEIEEYRKYNPGKNPVIAKGEIWTAKKLKMLKDAYNETAPDAEKIKGPRELDKFYTKADLVERKTVDRILKNDQQTKKWFYTDIGDYYDLEHEKAMYRAQNNGTEPYVYRNKVWSMQLLQKIKAEYNNNPKTPEFEKVTNWRTWDKFYTRAGLPERRDAEKVLSKQGSDRYALFGLVPDNYHVNNEIELFKNKNGFEPVVYKGRAWIAKELKATLINIMAIQISYPSLKK